MASTKRNFTEGPLYSIANYIFWFFSANFYFALLNLPLLWMLFNIAVSGTTALSDEESILLFASCITIAPSATALFSVMGKLLRSKDISVTKDFFKAYKSSFLQATFLGAIEMFILYALYIDAQFLFYKNYPPFTRVIVAILFVLVFSVGLYIFPIVSRFYLKSKDVVKYAVYYTFKKPQTTFFNLASFFIVGFIFFKISSYVLLFMGSIICFLIMFYEQNILLEIENLLKENSNE